MVKAPLRGIESVEVHEDGGYSYGLECGHTYKRGDALIEDAMPCPKCARGEAPVRRVPNTPELVNFLRDNGIGEESIRAFLSILPH